MRRFALTALLMVAAGSAQAGSLFDAPVLRGGIGTAYPAKRVNWEGVYVGGQVGGGFSNMNFTGATNDVIARLLTNTTIENEFQVSRWPLMGKTSSQGRGFGGFVGYNAQWDDAVLSVELNYLHGEFGGSSTGSMGRMFTTSDGYSNSVTSTSTAKMQIHDMMTLRARGGYATGIFMPYAFAGLSLGFADVLRSASVTASGVYIGSAAPPPPPYGPVTLSAVDQQNNQFIYGYTAGFGADVMVFRNVFLRGEYEYIRYTADTEVSINTIRGGVGVKF